MRTKTIGLIMLVTAGCVHVEGSSADPDPGLDPVSSADPDPGLDPGSSADPDPGLDPGSSARQQAGLAGDPGVGAMETPEETGLELGDYVMLENPDGTGSELYLCIPPMATAPAPAARDVRSRCDLIDSWRHAPNGGLGREVIGEIIKSHEPQIRECYEKLLVDDRSLSGRLNVSFVISPDGSVHGAYATESSISGLALPACVLERVREWSFPAPEGGGYVRVEYPWTFSPRSQPAE